MHRRRCVSTLCPSVTTRLRLCPGSVGISSWLVASLLALASAATVARAPGEMTSPVGSWHTIDDKDGRPRGIIEIVEKNGVLEGRIAGTLRTGEPADRVCSLCPGERRGQKMLGLLILSGLKRESQATGAAWSGGEILDPDSGKIYRVRLQLEDDGRTLNVRGYVGFALLGRTQRWQRAP